LRRLIGGTAPTSPSSSPLPLSSSSALSSLVEPSSPSTSSSGSPPLSPSSSSSDNWSARNFLPSGLPRLIHRRPPLPRRSRALPRTHCRHRLHLPVPRRGGTGGPRRRSGTHRPLTRLKSPTPLRPSAEEHKPHRRPWSRTPGSSPGWSKIRWKGWRNQRMRRPW
jgi:hypothetical protein